MTGESWELFTIGHSNQPLEHFMGLLEQHAIDVLVDVRRFPGSRKYPHFGQDALQAAATRQGLDYQWFEGLGGRRNKVPAVDKTCNAGLRNQSFHNYADYMLSSEFSEAFTELAQLASNRRTTIMCSESVFWRCHRRLISDYALTYRARVWHIFPDGRLRPHVLTSGAVVQAEDLARVVYPASSEST